VVVDVYVVDVYLRKDKTEVGGKKSVEVGRYAHYSDYKDLVRKNCFVEVKVEYYYERKKKKNCSDSKNSKRTEEVAMVGVVVGYPLLKNVDVVLLDRKIQSFDEWVS
jgi:hypothetical protein